MCGITGFWDQRHATPDADDVLRRMMDAIMHRGPDDSGAWSDPEAGVFLGHRRLSILDLSPMGHQPMTSASGRYVIIFNGEIYNFVEVREEEIARGTVFRGHSDTEVMLAAIERRGLIEAVRAFHGMFAFALWDRQERTLSLVRDRLGEKPLYYGWMGSTLLFGSELKALRAHPGWQGTVDRGALALFLRLSYVPGPHSIYEGVAKVRPGTILTFRSDRPREVADEQAYWSARDIAERGSHRTVGAARDQELLDGFDAVLRRTVRDEMIADVPLGAFLSGGIDSSLIVALMQAESRRPVQTFTIGFHEARFDEAPQARAVADHLGTSHTELYITPQDSLAVIPRLPSLFDEPFADPSQVPTFLVAQLARTKVTVSLSGDGGDELFGGYDRYLLSDRLWRRLQSIPSMTRAPLARGLRSVSARGWDRMLGLVGSGGAGDRFSGERVHKFAGLLEVGSREALYLRMLSHWPDPGRIACGARESRTILSDAAEWPKIDDFVSQMMYLDLVTYLPDDILVKVDRASMGVSLESRAPFLDHRVVEFAWNLPREAKIRAGRGKWLLRTLLDRYVPRALVDRPKMGFGVPIASWLRGPLRGWAAELLAPARLAREGLLDPGAITRRWDEHQSGERNWEFPLWDVLMFQAW
ncbi:MAG: asparagine synthase (glutamine-hydrolyzing), partial [Gemmatimonadota bacterium]